MLQYHLFILKEMAVTSHHPYLAETVAGLTDDIKKATEALIKATPNTVSVSSGCELFLRFITLTSLDRIVGLYPHRSTLSTSPPWIACGLLPPPSPHSSITT